MSSTLKKILFADQLPARRKRQMFGQSVWRPPQNFVRRILLYLYSKKRDTLCSVLVRTTFHKAGSEETTVPVVSAAGTYLALSLDSHSSLGARRRFPLSSSGGGSYQRCRQRPEHHAHLYRTHARSLIFPASFAFGLAALLRPADLVQHHPWPEATTRPA